MQPLQTAIRKDEDGYELDLKELIQILLRGIHIIIAATLVAGLIAFIITHFVITPLYSASIKLYVDNSTEMTTSITSSDVAAAQSLVDTYITIIQSDTVLDEVIAANDSPYSTEELMKKISASAMNRTEVLKVTVTTPDPQEAYELANSIAEIAPKHLSHIVSGSSVKIIDRAKMPQAPSSPNYKKNVAIGLLLGFIIACAFVIIRDLLDTRIKNETDLNRLIDLPVLGSITEFSEATKPGNGYGYGQTAREVKKHV
jgi:capsular polysaccharide biosynthesis protein